MICRSLERTRAKKIEERHGSTASTYFRNLQEEKEVRSANQKYIWETEHLEHTGCQSSYGNTIFPYHVGCTSHTNEQVSHFEEQVERSLYSEQVIIRVVYPKAVYCNIHKQS